jgi:hypothetical protein
LFYFSNSKSNYLYTDAYSKGGFLQSLYEPLDPSLEPGNSYTSADTNLDSDFHAHSAAVVSASNPFNLQGLNFGMPAAQTHSVVGPYRSPPAGTNMEKQVLSVPIPSNPYTLQGNNLQILADSVADPYLSPPTNLDISTHSVAVPIVQPFIQPPVSDLHLTPHVTIPDGAKEDGAIKITESRGHKRMGDDEAADKVHKRRRTNGVENVGIESRETYPGSEGMGMSGEMNERAGKPTLSGRVPLMPTHLADAGYQGEKKGVRGKKGQHTKKPKSKGYTSKPSSKGAVKIPTKKKGKVANSK